MSGENLRSRVGAAATRGLSRVFGPPEHVLSFVPVPSRPAWVPEGAKVDYLYWLTVLRRLQDEFDMEISNFLEIGANCAQDAWFIARQLSLDPKSIAVVEPVRTNAQMIRDNTDFLLFECVVSEEPDDVQLWVPAHDESAWGMASLGRRASGDADAFRPVTVASRSGTQIVDELGWPSLGLLKVDVEGFSATVLRSLGRRLEDARVVQIETERVAIWAEQETEDVVFEILKGRGFIMIDYQLANDGIQADSLWINSSHLQPRVFDRSTNMWKSFTGESESGT